jgi:ketosteroid isomerase-like protein
VTDSPEQIARAAFSALEAGDTASVLDLVATDLEWTFLDPTDPDPQPAVCHGRGQLAYWLERDSGWRLRAELVEVIAAGDKVLVVTKSPGIDQRRARSTGDRNFHVLTIRDGKIAALRACRDRNEALGFVGATP